MSSRERFIIWKHTPLYKNEQNDREILQWRLLRSKKTIPIKQHSKASQSFLAQFILHYILDGKTLQI